MFDPGPDLRLGAIFRPLDLIHDAAAAVTPIGEILGFWRVHLGNDPLASLLQRRLIAQRLLYLALCLNKLVR